ncbi:MAG: universal stress protein, partial [Streptomycetaceae bacterium]|nr:universal stress protein [Streptomycetaceae bacterium]
MSRQAQPYGGHIVVGTDGSEPAQRAVVHAAEEAARRDVPLEILHAADAEEYADRTGPTAYAAAHELLDAAAADARCTAPWLDVDTSLVRATPAGALVDASDAARLIVVGCRGLGGLRAMLVGSVGLALAAHA